jgi:hypothetical protein
MVGRRVRATADEASRPLPGDDFIRQPIGSLIHAISIRRPPRDVWPWLAQMGADRAGWYSYDFIDNGGRRSATGIVPELQQLSGGMVFPALPGVREARRVSARRHERSHIRREQPRDMNRIRACLVSSSSAECGHPEGQNVLP